MASISSYPRIQTNNIDSDDFLVITQNSLDKETLSITVGQITDYVVNSGAMGSSENLDFINSLKQSMSFEGGVLDIDGYYNTSETSNLVQGKADTSTVQALDNRLLSNENAVTTVDSNLSSHIAVYSANKQDTDIKLSELTGLVQGNITESYNNSVSINQNTQAISTLETNLTSNYTSYVDESLQDYSTSTVMQAYVTSAVSGKAEASSVTTLEATVNGNTSSISQNATAVSTEASTRASAVSSLQSSIDGNTSSITTNQSTIATVDGKVGALYTLDVTANGNVAGMKLGANNDSSFVSFVADSFKIYNGSTAYSPFEVVNGVVKIKSAAIGTITLGNISDAPDGFSQVTTVYASDINGSNASTTKGTKNFVAWYTGLDIWTPATGVSGLDFQQITGDTGAQGPAGNDGADGTSVTIKGSVASVNDLPTSNNVVGDGYLISGNLYVWDGSVWNEVGNIQGPSGQDGADGADGINGVDGSNGIDGVDGADGYTPLKGVDYFDGKDGSFISFIYKVSNTQPTTPTGGSYNGSTETIPSGWTDNPSVDTEDIEWMSTTRYSHYLQDDSWSNSGWSTPAKIYQKGATGDTGADGYTPQKGIDYDDGISGNNVRVEYSADGITGWTTTQQSGITYRYIRTSSDTNNNGIYIAGPVTKFVPEKGVEYNDGAPGVSSYVHIKYSNDGVSFTSNNGETVGDWIGTYVDSNEYDSTVFSDYTWKKIAGENGADGDSGLRNKTGIVWYISGTVSNPGQPTADGYDFSNNTITNLNSNWSLTPPLMQAGTASNKYWTSTYNIVEQVSPANTGTITFEPTTQAFGFDQVVTFNSLSSNSSTIINGGNITTGIIQSSNYTAPNNPYNGGFSEQGMGIDLNDGSIHAEQFYVNASGSAGFNGTINLTSAATSTRGAQTLNLSPGAGKISISHDALQINEYVSTEPGSSELGSLGLYVNNAGLPIENVRTFGGYRSREGYAACQLDGSRYWRENRATPLGQSFITGLFATAFNTGSEAINRDGQIRNVESFGAVVENLRADGLVERLHNIPQNASNPYQLPNFYAHYIHDSSTSSTLILPNDPRMGQVVKITRIGSSAPLVESNHTDYSGSGGTGKIRTTTTFSNNVTVSRTEEFIFQGSFWVRVNHD